MTRVLFVSAEPVGPAMAGPAIRVVELARALAAHCEVTVAAPGPSDASVVPGDLLEAGLADFDALLAAVREHDVVVAQRLPPQLLRYVARLPVRFVADLYNPQMIEVLEAGAGDAASSARLAWRSMLGQCAVADLVLCASEKQRDLWLGGMALSGLLDPDRYAADPTFRAFVDVVPFGLPEEPPQRDAPVMKGVWPGIGEDDRVLLWAGGVWRWLDPLTPMRALERLGEPERPVHLVFLGTGRPSLDPAAVPASEEEARRFARDRGLEDRVHFNPGWVPYAERGAYLLEADVGVCAHHDHLEARFSFRTRVLDHFWAGLPSVVSAATRSASWWIAASSAGRSRRRTTRASPLRSATCWATRHATRPCVSAWRRSRRRSGGPSARVRSSTSAWIPRGGPRGDRRAEPWRARRSGSTATCCPTCASAAAWARPPAACSGTSGAPAGTVPDRAGAAALLGRFRYPLLFAAGALLSGLTILNGINPHDEGLVLQAAARIVNGELPYRDFYANYGPGQYYLDGALDFVFGPSLLTWRIVRVALDALVAVLAYALVRREGSEPLALLAWVAVLFAMAHPTLPHPNAAALALAFGAILLARRSPVAAGVLAGVAFAFRFDLGAAAAVGAALAAAAAGALAALRVLRVRSPPGHGRRPGAAVRGRGARRLLGRHLRLRARRAVATAAAAPRRLGRRLRAEQDPRLLHALGADRRARAVGRGGRGAPAAATHLGRAAGGARRTRVPARPGGRVPPRAAGRRAPGTARRHRPARAAGRVHPRARAPRRADRAQRDRPEPHRPDRSRAATTDPRRRGRRREGPARRGARARADGRLHPPRGAARTARSSWRTRATTSCAWGTRSSTSSPTGRTRRATT